MEFSHINPVYRISSDKCSNPIIGFSKLYDETHHKKPFIAITTCSNANENCLFIPDAIQRFRLPFTDPKAFVGSPLQAEKYLEENKLLVRFIIFLK